MKSGFKTSEFWITVGIILFALGIGGYALHSNKGMWSDVTAAVALGISYLKAHGYNSGRVKQKIEELVLGTDTPPTPAPIAPPAPVAPPQIIVQPSPVNPPQIVVQPPPDNHSVEIETKVTKDGTVISTTVK